MTNKKQSSLLSLAVCVGMALPLMGNQGCEQQEGRILKKQVRLGEINGRKFSLPDGKEVSFGDVMESQVGEALITSKNFLLFPSRAKLTAHLTPAQKVRSAASTFRTFAEPLPSCVHHLPQFIIDGDIRAMEFVGGGEVIVGYTQDTPADQKLEVKAKVQVDVFQMVLGLQARDPLVGAGLAAATGSPTGADTHVGAEIDFGQISVDPVVHFPKSLAKISMKGVNLALNAMTESLAARPWEAQVFENLDTHITINAGSEAGLKIGDVLSVHNVRYRWEGEVCNSRAHRFLVDPVSSPNALIKLIDVGPFTAMGEVVPGTQDLDRNPQQGALVLVKELAP